MKRFEGWEPAEVTTVTAFDDQGRPAKWVTRREAEWDRGERAWMLGLDYYEATLCRKCGHALHESTDPEHDPDNPAASHRYQAEDPTECFACKTLMRSEKKWAKDNPDLAPALIHTAVLIERPKRGRQRSRG